MSTFWHFWNHLDDQKKIACYTFCILSPGIFIHFPHHDKRVQRTIILQLNGNCSVNEYPAIMVSLMQRGAASVKVFAFTYWLFPILWKFIPILQNVWRMRLHLQNKRGLFPPTIKTVSLSWLIFHLQMAWINSVHTWSWIWIDLHLQCLIYATWTIE